MNKLFLLLLLISAPTNAQSPFEIKLRSDIKQVNLRGIPEDFVVTVAAHETGYGISKPFRRLNNAFSMTSTTGTLIGNRHYKKYENQKESIKDFVRLISTRHRYSVAYYCAVHRRSYEFFMALQRAGYAEDKKYAAGLEKTYQNIMAEDN